MVKPNAEVERLEGEVRMLRKIIETHRQDPGDMPNGLGCGDGSCEVRRPSGMRTNGGCHCEARSLLRGLRWWKRVAQFRAETIREMPTEHEVTDSIVAWLRGPEWGDPAALDFAIMIERGDYRTK